MNLLQTIKEPLKNLEYLLNPKGIMLALTLLGGTALAQTTTVQGTVKDKQTPSIFLDSAYVRGIDLNTHELLFEDYTDINGFYQKEIITAVEDETYIPTKFEMSQNYPNPFNPSTKVNIYVPETKNYNLGIFNILGKEIISENYEDLRPGNYTFDISGLGPAGVYFYRISSDDYSETKKMVQLDGSYFNPKITKHDNFSEGSLKKITENIEMRIYASKQGYLTDSVDVSYVEGSTNTQDFLLDKNTFDFNATIKLYKTFKGQAVTDLDSVFVQWPDGTVDGYPNNNGTISINKELTTLNADTTAQLFHKHPEQYLKWMIGHKVSSKPEWLFQNETPSSTSKMPLNVVKQEGTVELYLVQKFANYGPDNTTPMDMESATVNSFFGRSPFPYTSCFQPSPAGYDTTNVLQFTFNETTGNPITQDQLNRAYNELNKFLTATDWSHKNLVVYKFNNIGSYSDPLLQSIITPPRNFDNFTYTAFRDEGPGNGVTIATDGTKRIFNSRSQYNINSSDGQMQEEIFDSFLNTNIDGPSYILQANASGLPYTDLAHNLIGISYIFKPGTQYSQ